MHDTSNINMDKTSTELRIFNNEVEDIDEVKYVDENIDRGESWMNEKQKKDDERQRIQRQRRQRRRQ